MISTKLYHYAELSPEAQNMAVEILGEHSHIIPDPIQGVWDQYRDAAEILGAQAMCRVLNWPDPIAFAYYGPEDFDFDGIDYPPASDIPYDGFWMGVSQFKEDWNTSTRIQTGFENLIAQAEDYIAEFDWSAYFDEHNVLFYEDGQPTVKL